MGTEKPMHFTDDAGYFAIEPIDPGTYDIEIRALGYDPKILTGIQITAGRTTNINDVSLSVPGEGKIQEVEIEAFTATRE